MKQIIFSFIAVSVFAIGANTAHAQDQYQLMDSFDRGFGVSEKAVDFSHVVAAYKRLLTDKDKDHDTHTYLAESFDLMLGKSDLVRTAKKQTIPNLALYFKVQDSSYAYTPIDYTMFA